MVAEEMVRSTFGLDISESEVWCLTSCMSSLYDLFIFGRLLVIEKLDQLTLDCHRPYCPSISDFLPDMGVSSAQNLSFQTP